MTKAVFFDIDGTLVSFKTHQVPESTLKAIRKLKEKGIKVFIATGRSFLHIGNIKPIGFDAYVTLNGSLCINGKEEVIYKNPIPQSDITALRQYFIDKYEISCAFVSEKDLLINIKSEEMRSIETLLNVELTPTCDFSHIPNMDIYQIVAFFKEELELEIMNKVMTHSVAARWNPLFADVVAKGNTKSHGIDEVLKYYNIPLANTICFGDGGNDIPMLQHTPISVAMGNASDEVKSHATHVTDSVDDDGIWNALVKLGVL